MSSIFSVRAQREPVKDARAPEESAGAQWEQEQVQLRRELINNLVALVREASMRSDPHTHRRAIRLPSTVRARNAHPHTLSWLLPLCAKYDQLLFVGIGDECNICIEAQLLEPRHD